jgi:hypothetical protein
MSARQLKRFSPGEVMKLAHEQGPSPEEIEQFVQVWREELPKRLEQLQGEIEKLKRDKVSRSDVNNLFG